MSHQSKIRCPWLNTNNKLYIEYHDKEWGKPVRDDNKLFEMLILEGAQAGLSWETILNKRACYRRLFAEFEPEKVARFSRKKIEALYLNPGIVRNKLKINSTISNAKCFLAIQEEFGSFNKYIWKYVNNKPILNRFKSLDEYPSETELSKVISKDLKKRGFKFVGPTIIYAFMQAVGMVNDHSVDCYLHKKDKKWSVYILACHDGSLYTGISNDVSARLRVHAEGGSQAAKYLKGKGPFKLVYQHAIGSKGDALREEARIKKLKKIDKIKFIENQ